MRGKFIVFEGIDGCGKTTQIEEISKWIPTSGLLRGDSKLVKTREYPSDCHNKPFLFLTPSNQGCTPT